MSQRTVEREWVLSGQVQDTTGAGIAEVAIDLFNASTGDEIVDLSGALTGPGGSFAVTIDVAIPVGLYDVIFVPPPGAALFAATTQVFLSGSFAVPLVTLENGFRVSGQVVDDLGTGLSTADRAEPDHLGASGYSCEVLLVGRNETYCADAAGRRCLVEHHVLVEVGASRVLQYRRAIDFLGFETTWNPGCRRNFRYNS